MATGSHALSLFLFFLLSALLNLSEAKQPQYTTYAFPTFLKSDLQNFSMSYNAGGIAQGALQVTPDTANNLSYFVNRSGRVLLKDPITLWSHSNSSSPNRIASFNTSFTVNVHRLDNYNSTVLGHGIAFLIAPSLDEPPPNSHGQYLGLTNSTLDGDPSNRIVAVELDTVKQSFDPDDNHVGLDINSVRSNTTARLSPLGIEIGPPDGSSNNVWIDYDGSRRHVWVYMAPLNQSKPSSPVLEAPLDLSEHVNSLSYLGFAASTGDTELQLNCVKAWNLSVELLPNNESESKHSSRTTAWVLALAIALPLAIAIAAAGGASWYWLVKRKKVGTDPSVLAGTLRSLPGTPREFELKVLSKATNNFDERMKLGHGGFGVVYKGVIPGEETEVAVKRFSRDNMRGQDDFVAELSIINRLRHKHLVKLLGESLMHHWLLNSTYTIFIFTRIYSFF